MRTPLTVFPAIVITTIITIALTNCSADRSEKEADNKPTGVIPQHQLDALEKAKAVEDVLQKDLEEKAKKIDESTN